MIDLTALTTATAMWKSEYKCFVIKSRFVCTKDNDLATVYSLIEKSSIYLEYNDTFEGLFKQIIDNLAAFARNRHLSDDRQYLALRKSLSLACDTCSLDPQDFEDARNSLVDCLYKCQELEEAADKIAPPGVNAVENKEYDKSRIARELRITATHITRDMSVTNSYDTLYYTDIDLSKKETIDIILDPLDGGRVQLVAADVDSVTLLWAGNKYVVELDGEVLTDVFAINNPGLSSDSLKLSFAYRELPSYAELWSMIAKLSYDELNERVEHHELTKHKKQIRHFIDKAIEAGNSGLYVAKALLSEYSDWGSARIDNIDAFQKELLDGIKLGCLAPDNYFGWEWMEVIARNNDPETFLEDMELYYDLLSTAAEHGVVEAIDLMNSIWEPEDIIEED